MKFWKIFTFLSFAVFHLLSSQEDNPALAIEPSDIEALRDWASAKKRQVTVKERGGNLSIGGEVRFEFQSTNEKKNGIKQRGSRGAVPKTAMRAWDVEVNLLLDYRTERTWMNVKLKFDNDAGIDNGTSNRISLDRAYFGGRIVSADLYNISMTVGRRHLNYAFDSKIQFGSFMDGILIRYEHAFENICDFYFHGGPFLVDETIDQYAYVGELGLLNIGATGLYSKLSFINWDTKKTGDRLRNLAYQFRNLQLILGYKFTPDWLWGKVTTIYATGLYNTAARKHKETGYQRQPFAWYAGFSIGELRKQWDWSFNINYQWVQNQAVSDFDGSGIKRGNAAKAGLYSTKPKGQGKPITQNESVGSGNFKGFTVQFVYNLLDNLTVFQSYAQSVNCTTSIGPAFSYKQYEIELIYLF